jgi:hypothetical protein
VGVISQSGCHPPAHLFGGEADANDRRHVDYRMRRFTPEVYDCPLENGRREPWLIEPVFC